jgi:3-oxoacyl-[acyl-carrier-protein] synthase III
MKILSLANSLPSRIMTNADVLAEAIARNSHLPPLHLELLKRKLSDLLSDVGAQTRRRRAEGEKAVHLGTVAGERALQKSGLSPEEIDLLVYTSVSRGFIEPSTANVFQQTLGLERATCFDLLDACAGWIRGLEIVESLIDKKNYRYAMLLSCEFNCEEYYPVIDSPEHLRDAVAGFTVGEAATATIVSAEPGEVSCSFSNVGAGSALCQIPLPNADQFCAETWPTNRRPLQFYAQARALNSMAIDAVSELFWRETSYAQQSYDLVFGHSAGLPATRKVAQRLKLDPRVCYEIFPEFGNTVSASIPLAMSLAEEDGSLQRGHRVLLVVGSAGITAALAALVF